MLDYANEITASQICLWWPNPHVHARHLPSQFTERGFYVQKNHSDHLLWSRVEHKMPLDFNSWSKVALAKGSNFSNEFSARDWSGLQEVPHVLGASSLHQEVTQITTEHHCQLAGQLQPHSQDRQSSQKYPVKLRQGKKKKKREWMSSIQKKSTLLICICTATNTTKPMKSSVFKQYHNANIFLLAPLPSPRSWSCQPCLTPVWSWKGEEHRTPQKIGVPTAPAHRKGKWFSTPRRCPTPKEEAEAESRTVHFRPRQNNICSPHLIHRQDHLAIKTDTLTFLKYLEGLLQSKGTLDFWILKKTLEKHVDSRITFYSSPVCSVTKPNRKKSLLRHLMTTPNTSVCYIYSLPGSISHLLQETRICLLSRYQSPASPPNSTFNASTWKSLFSGNQEENSATLNSSISLGTTPLKTLSKRQSTHHSWFPRPVTSYNSAWRLCGRMDQSTCSLTWLPAQSCDHPLWHEEGGENRVGKRSIQSPLLAAVTADPVFHKPHPELSSHPCYPTHTRQNPISQIRNAEI